MYKLQSSTYKPLTNQAAQHIIALTQPLVTWVQKVRGGGGGGAGKHNGHRVHPQLPGRVGRPPQKWTGPFFLFLASQDALEVMLVTDLLTER